MWLLLFWVPHKSQKLLFIKQTKASKNSRQWNCQRRYLLLYNRNQLITAYSLGEHFIRNIFYRFSNSGLASSLLVQVWFYVFKIIGLFLYIFVERIITGIKQGFFCKASRNDKREWARTFSLGNERCAREWVTRAGKKEIQSTPDNSNLQGKLKKVRVIGSSKKIAESKVKNRFTTVWTF